MVQTCWRQGGLTLFWGVEGSGCGVQNLKRRVCCFRVQPLRQCLQRPKWRFEGSHLGLAVESYSRPPERD